MKKALLLLTLAAAAACAGELAGKRAASFTLPDSTGKYYDLLDYRGKVVIVDAMRTDCPHCQTLAKVLNRAKAKYGDKIQVFSIVTPPDNPKTVSDFIAKYKVSSPILFDCGQATGALLRITAANPSVSLPHLIIVDKQGVVHQDWPYSDNQKAVFEGDAMFPVIDAALAKK